MKGRPQASPFVYPNDLKADFECSEDSLELLTRLRA